MKKFNKDFLFYLVVIFLSFLIYSARFSFYFNRDQAVHILMVPSFRFPEDLYYWGQNRLGSIMPMLAIPFYKLGISAIVSLAISQYLLIISTFLLIVNIFKSRTIRYSFCLLYFFPIIYFNTILSIAHPYVGQLFFSAVLFNFFNYFENKNWLITNNKDYIKIGLGVISVFLAIWSSEIAVILPISLFLTFIYKFRIQIKNYLIELSNFIEGVEFHFLTKLKISIVFYRILLLILILSFLGIFFIYIAKKYAIGEDYGVFLVNSDQFIYNLTAIKNGIIKTLLFGHETNKSSIVVYGLLILFINIFFKKFYLKLNNIEVFMILNIIGSFIICVLSRWVYSWDVPTRYFSPMYFWFIVFLLYVIDIKFIYSELLRLCVFIVSSLSLVLVYEQINNFLKSKSNYSSMCDFRQFGKATIIGGDWYDNHLVAIANPEELYSIPFQNGLVRNKHQVEIALKNDNIYILNSDHSPISDTSFFSDRFSQFGYEFVKSGKVFRFKDYYNMCKYKLVGKQKNIEYNARQIPYNNGNVVTDTLCNPKFSIETASNHTDGAFCFGPYLSLVKGTYKVHFYLRKMNNFNSEFATTLYVANAINHIIASKDVTNLEMSDTNKYYDYMLEFEVTDENAKHEFIVIQKDNIILRCNKILVEKIN